MAVMFKQEVPVYLFLYFSISLSLVPPMIAQKVLYECPILSNHENDASGSGRTKKKN